jgi:hypothetical protein
MFFLASALLAGALTVLVATVADAAEFKKIEECAVGTKVADRQNKTGKVVGVSNGMCRVLLDESGQEKSYLHWMLRPAGASQAPADKLVNGAYKCYSSAGSTINYAFMDIHIDGPTAYRDKNGAGGRYRLESSGRIVFESGPLTTANAKLLAGPKIGLNMNGGSFFNMTCGLKK